MNGNVNKKQSFIEPGQTWGRWTVLSYAGFKKKGRRGYIHKWHCRCDCGNEGEVISYKLTSGRSQSCGCGRERKILISLDQAFQPGEQHGPLTVLEFAGVKTYSGKQRQGLWRCRCVCGREVVRHEISIRARCSNRCYCPKAKGGQGTGAGRVPEKLGLLPEKQRLPAESNWSPTSTSVCTAEDIGQGWKVFT